MWLGCDPATQVYDLITSANDARQFEGCMQRAGEASELDVPRGLCVVLVVVVVVEVERVVNMHDA